MTSRTGNPRHTWAWTRLSRQRGHPETGRDGCTACNLAALAEQRRTG
jgi:hypothetical protein